MLHIGQQGILVGVSQAAQLLPFTGFGAPGVLRVLHSVALDAACHHPHSQVTDVDGGQVVGGGTALAARLGYLLEFVHP